MDDNEREELEADIEKIHHTLESDRSQWQFDDDYDSDDDSDDEALYIDLDKRGSATVSIASASAHSGGGRTTPSVQSITSHPTTESLATEQDDAEQLFREVGVVFDRIEDSSSLPASLESCLIINRAYQDIIMEHITRLELALAENREAQKKFEDDAKENTRQMMTKKRFPYAFCVPYFKSTDGTCPQPNEDVRLKQITHEPDLDCRPDPKWTNRHKRLLIEAVKEDSLEKLLQPLLSRRELEEEKLQQVPENSEEARAIEEKIHNIDREISLKQCTPDEHLLRDIDTERVDWMKIANLTFAGKRDYRACKRAWMHSVDPKLNMSPVTPEESAKLRRLVQETKARNWVYIAQQLGTGRTAYQCLQYFQQKLNNEKLQREWVKEEDEKLVRVVEKCQQYHFNWHRVSQYMEGRNSAQCYKRFSKLDPSHSSGHWSEEEDAQLMAAVQLVGSNWGKVQELVPGRTREQCRERYLNSLDPAISGKCWTYEEDRELLKGLQKYPGQWVKICREFCPGRTDNQVLQRFRRLQDWKRKTEWFECQPRNAQNLLQGNDLPAEKREVAKKRNWDQYRELFNILPCDYEKQRVDKEKGLPVVPRPPFLLGLASKRSAKVWEKRTKLQQLIEEHVEKMREHFEVMDDNTITGMYDLQGAISSLTQKVLSQHKLTAEVVGTRTPSMVSVGDMLAITRGNVEQLNRQRNVRGPHKKRRHRARPMNTTKMLAVNKVDSELRRVIRTKMKSRALKRGRPRRFFWDTSVEQGLSEHDRDMLKATAMNLYFKSLGADPGKLLANARRQFPDLAAELMEQNKTSRQHTSDEEMDFEPQLNTLNDNGAHTVRRSRRSRKPVRDDRMLGMALKKQALERKDPEDVEMSQKRKDYEKLEWMCRLLKIPPEYPPPEDVSGEVEVESGTFEHAATLCNTITCAATSTVSVTGGCMRKGVAEGAMDGTGDRHRLTGMLKVHEIIQQAEKEHRERESLIESSENLENLSTHASLSNSAKGGDEDQIFQAAESVSLTHESSQLAKTNILPQKSVVSATDATDNSSAADKTAFNFNPDGGHTLSTVAMTRAESEPATVNQITAGESVDEQAEHNTPEMMEVSTAVFGCSVHPGPVSMSKKQQMTTPGSSTCLQPVDDSQIRCNTVPSHSSIAVSKMTTSAATSSAEPLSASTQMTVIEENEEPRASAETESSHTDNPQTASVRVPAQTGPYSFAIPTGQQPQEYRVFPNFLASSIGGMVAGTGEQKLIPGTTVRIQASDNRPKLPNIPPTLTSLQSFKLLLLKRLELIQKAGPYYNAPYYQAKKDAQMASLVKAGKHLSTVNRGSIDLSRLMKKVTQDTEPERKRKGRKRKQPEEEKFSDTPQFNSYEIIKAVHEHEEYKTLAARFEALYFWPGFLSAVYPPFQRTDFSHKAIGADKPSNPVEKPFRHLQTKLPMLKTKRFYKYANKSKSEKQAYLQSQKEKRILRQVKALMADEDDPNPEVHLHSDSEDDISNTVTSTRANGGNNNSNSTAADINPRVHAATCTVNSSVHMGVNEPQPSTSRAGEEEGEPVGVPKKKRKLPIRRPKNLIPSRQSERALKRGMRVSYSDKMHLKSKKGCGRKPPYSDRQKSIEGTVRIRRIGKYNRRRMIAAMVEMKLKEDKEKKKKERSRIQRKSGRVRVEFRC